MGLVIRDELEQPTEEEVEIEKEFIDPEADPIPKEEEAKKPEEAEGEEEEQVKEPVVVGLEYQLARLQKGRQQVKLQIPISNNYLTRARKLMEIYNEKSRITHGKTE